MKKIYSIVLMATALFIGTNVNAGVSNFADLKTAMLAGGDVVLDADITDFSATILIDNGKTVNLDLNGKNITANIKDPMFKVFNGHLNLKGTGKIESTRDTWETSGLKRPTDGIAIQLGGTNDENDADIATLNVGAGVSIIGHSRGIYVDYKGAAGTLQALDYAGNTKGCCFGVRVEVSGKVSGRRYGMQISGNIKWAVAEGTDPKTTNVPTFHINEGAEVSCPIDKVYSAAVYAGGYGVVILDKANVHGATGIYAKGSYLEIKDSRVASDAASYASAQGHTSGLESIGSAIVLDSHTSYAGNTQMIISGESSIESDKGYCIESPNTKGDNKVNAVTISGGTFDSGEQGCLNLDPVIANSEAEIVVTGGNYDQPIDAVLAASTTNTIVGQSTGKDGKTIYTIVTNPTTEKIDDHINAALDETFQTVEWQDKANGLLGKDNVTMVYLALAGTSDLTIKENQTLTVGSIVIAKKSAIILEPGAKLVITGKDGLVAAAASNLVIKTQEGKPAYFLLAPAVEYNRHPMATVEFISKSFVNGADFAVQRFGIPSHKALVSIDAVDPATSAKVPTKFGAFNYAKNQWDEIGGINGKTPALDLNALNNPFDYYQMINYATEAGTKVIMTGELVGNQIPQLNVRGNFWNGYSNSLLGNMKIAQLLDMIPGTVDKAIYLYDINAVQATWEPVTFLGVASKSVLPLQPFLIRNTKAAAAVDVDYAAAVYNPTLNLAPARRSINNITMAKLIVKGEECIDRVTVAEDAQFSAEFDNGYDAAKYMNDGINMYVSANEKMSVFATDNLENTYVGFQSINGGNYTIDFTDVNGKDLTLIDHETGARVAMIEGNVYEFTAEANTTNDYRFQIVGSHNAPTAVENVSAANAGAVYTIFGQYVGEMSEWNTLPAGIYVVDGVKRVK